MREYVQKNGFGNTSELIQLAYAVADKYGNAAAELTCQMYEATAEAQGVYVQAAEPAETPTYAEVAKTVNGTIDSPETMCNAVGRLTKRTGADTMLKNAIRDGAEFAWVPHGDTCAFCITLASRGWQKASKKALKNGHAEHIHANCDCQYEVRFDGKSNVEGYDPDEYLKMYNGDGESDSPKEKINRLRRELEKEKSNKWRKNAIQETLVNRKIVESVEYREKIDSITESKTESRGIAKGAREIFNHRDGTRYEDLAYIDSRTGKIIINRDYDYYDEVEKISACKPNRKMLNMLGYSDAYTIIGVHNHPGSGAPSMADIVIAQERKYKYGIVLCHDGTIYKYSVDEWMDRANNNNLFWLARLDKAVYNQDEKRKIIAIDELKKLGIKIEVL